MSPAEIQSLVDQALALAPGDLATEYQNELSYRIAQEVRLRIQGSGLSLREFAVKHQLDAPQLSRQLSGTHNFTLKSVARLAVVLQEPLLAVCQRPSNRFAEAKLPTTSISALSPQTWNLVIQPMRVRSLESGLARGRKPKAVRIVSGSMQSSADTKIPRRNLPLFITNAYTLDQHTNKTQIQ